jgi:thioredoxin-dependent peroxiredoxin
MAKVTLKGNPIQTNGELPSVGTAAPDFTLVDSDLKDRKLSEFKGKRILLLTVPSLDTSVCSLETKKFNDKIKSHPELLLIVASADLPFAQKRFCASEGVSNAITLSMMRSKDFATKYGVLIQDGPLAGVCARSILVIDEAGKIIYTELVPEITQEPNYDKAFEAATKK